MHQQVSVVFRDSKTKRFTVKDARGAGTKPRGFVVACRDGVVVITDQAGAGVLYPLDRVASVTMSGPVAR